MRLKFKEGSPLYNELVRLYQIRLDTYEQALGFIEELCGERPESIGYSWGFDRTCIWNPTMIAFKEGYTPDPALFSLNKDYSEDDDPLYKLLRKRKAGRDTADRFDIFHNSLTSEGLEKLGLPMYYGRAYYFFLPVKTEEGYFLDCSNNVINVLPDSEDIEIVRSKEVKTEI